MSFFFKLNAVFVQIHHAITTQMSTQIIDILKGGKMLSSKTIKRRARFTRTKTNAVLKKLLIDGLIRRLHPNEVGSGKFQSLSLPSDEIDDKLHKKKKKDRKLSHNTKPVKTFNVFSLHNHIS
jgi:hypothetical protein